MIPLGSVIINAVCCVIKLSLKVRIFLIIQVVFSSCNLGVTDSPRDFFAIISSSVKKKLTPRSFFSTGYGSTTWDIDR